MVVKVTLYIHRKFYVYYCKTLNTSLRKQQKYMYFQYQHFSLVMKEGQENKRTKDQVENSVFYKDFYQLSYLCTLCTLKIGHNFRVVNGDYLLSRKALSE